MNMTDKFEDRDTFLHWFIIASLTGVEITEEIKANPMLVTMQINGQEVNPANSIERLEQQFDRMVKDKACEMLDDLRFDATEKLGVVMAELIENIKGE
tara:strand:- start:495 stop:788 length:294 start_codon:yes stop_codon:yes gene_type:complete